VLSAGPVLEALQPGDVILRVDGKAVATPREVMDALRGKPAESTVPVDYLRDRKPSNARIKVPEPGRMPAFGAIDIEGMPAMPGARMHRRRVMVDQDGKVSTVEDGDKAE
jgi:membrane-associated protease RseP (regulator of RpoE activity)